jgi:hypothetical protein
VADSAQNSIPEAEPTAVPEVAVKSAVARTTTAKKAKPATKSRSKPRQKGAKRKLSAKQRAERDNRFTPPQMIHAIEESFGKINFDPCWHAASAVKPGAHLDIRKGQDGLTDMWKGPLAFVNPPWSLAKKFLERAYDQWKAGRADTILCLVPSKTDTTFFHTVLKAEADVYFVEHRMRFFKEDGTSNTTAESVMIVMFGATEIEKLRFVARVPGSWWLTDRQLSDGVGLPRGGRHRSRPANNLYSCSAETPLDGRYPTVLCNPIGAQM